MKKTTVTPRATLDQMPSPNHRRNIGASTTRGSAFATRMYGSSSVARSGTPASVNPMATPREPPIANARIASVNVVPTCAHSTPVPIHSAMRRTMSLGRLKKNESSTPDAAAHSHASSINTYRGVREVNGVIIDNARMLGASRGQLVRHVLVPSALTWIFSSLHISSGMTIVAVVVGEYLGASRGIGYLIAQAEGVFDTTGVFAGMVVLAAWVLVVGALISRLERRLLRWKPEYEESRTGRFA